MNGERLLDYFGRVFCVEDHVFQKIPASFLRFLPQTVTNPLNIPCDVELLRDTSILKTPKKNMTAPHFAWRPVESLAIFWGNWHPPLRFVRRVTDLKTSSVTESLVSWWIWLDVGNWSAYVGITWDLYIYVFGCFVCYWSSRIWFKVGGMISIFLGNIRSQPINSIGAMKPTTPSPFLACNSPKRQKNSTVPMFQTFTPPKTNMDIMDTQNSHVWKEIHFPNHHFWYLC